MRAIFIKTDISIRGYKSDFLLSHCVVALNFKLAGNDLINCILCSCFHIIGKIVGKENFYCAICHTKVVNISLKASVCNAAKGSINYNIKIENSRIKNIVSF